MTLHIVNSCKPPLLELCIDGDEILLIEDGVYQRLESGAIQVYKLRADLEARGLRDDEAIAVDYEGFVALCAKHDKVVSW